MKLFGYLAALVIFVALPLLFGMAAIPVILVLVAIYMAERIAQRRERELGKRFDDGYLP